MQDIDINLSISGRTLKMTFDLNSEVHREMISQTQKYGAYERATARFLGHALKPGQVFLDIGAHIGYFTVTTSAILGDMGRVIAVEPTDENHRRLETHVVTNQLDNVTIFKAVISGEDGEATLHLNKDNDGGHAIWDPALHPVNDKTRAAPDHLIVPSMTLKTLLAEAQVDHVRVMKIDTEGAEATILKSAEGELREGRVDFIIAEVNIFGLEQMGSSVGDFFQLGRDLGFIVCTLDDEGRAPKLLTSFDYPDPRYVFNILLARPEALNQL